MTLRWLSLLSIFLSGIFGEEKPLALIGTILSANQTLPNGTLVIINGHIAGVGIGISIPNNAIVLPIDGVILPGLIDLHNHLRWNVFPRWKPMEEFRSRYDWQQKPMYRILLDSPYRRLVEAGLSCEMQRYAEVKAMIHGATSVIGSLLEPCNQGLVRNLDDDPSLGQNIYNVFPFLTTDDEIESAKNVLAANGSLLIHLAEGSPTDATSALEFMMLQARDLLKPGVSLIHGVALKENDFRLMANASVGLVWSLRSNFELYGNTINLQAVLKHGVVTAIAPDWSPTGSDGLLSELNYAAMWNAGLEPPLLNDRQLLEMATVNPAKLVHLDQRLGVLKEGYLADVLVLQSNQMNQSNYDAFWTATHSTPEDVMLVIIDGKAVYGDRTLMKQLVNPNGLESLEICGVEKSISFASQMGSQLPFRHTQKLLNKAMRHFGRTLAPLSECGH